LKIGRKLHETRIEGMTRETFRDNCTFVTARRVLNVAVGVVDGFASTLVLMMAGGFLLDRIMIRPDHAPRFDLWIDTLLGWGFVLIWVVSIVALQEYTYRWLLRFVPDSARGYRGGVWVVAVPVSLFLLVTMAGIWPVYRGG
jgi:hypothetical protein